MEGCLTGVFGCFVGLGSLSGYVWIFERRVGARDVFLVGFEVDLGKVV